MKKIKFEINNKNIFIEDEIYIYIYILSLNINSYFLLLWNFYRSTWNSCILDEIQNKINYILKNIAL
jgi:hypothetical protein